MAEPGQSLDPEIGRELFAADLEPFLNKVVVWQNSGATLFLTLWLRMVDEAAIELYSGEMKASLLLVADPDGTLHDNSGAQSHIFEYLGPV